MSHRTGLELRYLTTFLMSCHIHNTTYCGGEAYHNQFIDTFLDSSN